MNQTGRCTHCGNILRLHIMSQSVSGWQVERVCEHCQHHNRKAVDPFCPECGLHLREFMNRGLLGCANCYDALAIHIDPLLTRYRGDGPEMLQSRPLIHAQARARTQEIAEICGIELRDNADSLARSDPAVPLLQPFRQAIDDLKKYLKDDLVFSGDVLHTCRIRLARNLDGFPYWNHLDERQRQQMVQPIFSSEGYISAIKTTKNKSDRSESDPSKSDSSAKNPCSVNPGKQDLESEEIEHLKNRRIVPLQAEYAAMLEEENCCIYAGDEDHLRLQLIVPVASGSGVFFDFFGRALSMLQSFDELFCWQFHPVYGYQTACPANSGSGMRISFMLDLHAIMKSGGWPHWKKLLHRSGFEIRGAAGEGSRPEDGRFQISNRYWSPGADIIAEIRWMFAVLGRMRRRELECRRGNTA